MTAHGLEPDGHRRRSRLRKKSELGACSVGLHLASCFHCPQALKMKVPRLRLFEQADNALDRSEVDFKTELRWEKSDYDGSKILQATTFLA